MFKTWESVQEKIVKDLRSMKSMTLPNVLRWKYLVSIDSVFYTNIKIVKSILLLKGYRFSSLNVLDDGDHRLVMETPFINTEAGAINLFCSDIIHDVTMNACRLTGLNWSMEIQVDTDEKE